MNLFRQKDISIGVSKFPILHSSFLILHSSFLILHSSFPIPHSPFFILHSSFLIPHFIEVYDDFLATVEGVGDYGVFREIGAE